MKKQRQYQIKAFGDEGGGIGEISLYEHFKTKNKRKENKTTNLDIYKSML